ncbi:MAG: hypothetical protein ACJAR2_003784 [Ilumatobacter sp.]|jgi:hypothetical protein
MQIGWFESVPPNGRVARPAEAVVNNNNDLGLATPEPDIEIETTPEHRNLINGDPECTGWSRRRDDPGVIARRDTLRANNGKPDLEICGPNEIVRATELFQRDGFVVVADALPAPELAALQTATDVVMMANLAVDPDGSAGGGAGGLPHRYSFGSTSGSRHRLHEQAWVDVIDLPVTTALLTSIFGSDRYIVGGGGGDYALPGAIEYQGLHSDNVWTELHDPVGGLTMRDLPVPVITIMFPMIDLTWENGPIRQIAGTQRSHEPIPNLVDEPNSMKWSTLCPVPTGCAVVRDNRGWHGGTPNLSDVARAMPNIEYFAPWFRSEGVNRCMPHQQWLTLSEHGRRISRYVAAAPGETVLGAGFNHPRAHARDAFIEQQQTDLGDVVTAAWWAKR